jgi:Xaa-Pro aminopeptidase
MDPNARLERFRNLLAISGIEQALVTWPPHVTYLTGVSAGWGPAYLLVAPVRLIAIAPETLREDYCRAGAEVHSFPEGPFAADSRRAALETLAAAAPRSARGRGGIERGRATAAEVHAAGIRATTDITPLLETLRARKDASEVERIRANLALLATGFEGARGAIAPGHTELDIWSAIELAISRDLGRPFLLEGNLASGPRTLEAEPHATSRALHPGETVLVDLYPIIDGYCADLTRVLVVGEPTPAQIERHAVLERALRVGAAALRPGVAAGDVDAAIRANLAEAGFPNNFPHHAGHGIGIEGQEAPYLVPGNPAPLEAGMVVAIEPGLYLPDTGGMRLEGNYLITDEGAMALSDYPLTLIHS